MPTIFKQPSNVALPTPYVSGWGECATIGLSLSDIFVTAGGKAQINITVTSANIVTGTAFTVAAQPFAVSSVIPQPANTVNFTAGTALQKAQRLKMMLEMNAYISENFTITDPVVIGANYQIQIIAKRNAVIDVTTTVPSPYTTTQAAGFADQPLYDRIGYRVFVAGTQINKPGFDILDPTYSINGAANTLYFDVNHLVRPFLQTTYPLTPPLKIAPFCDNTIRRLVRVEAFGIKTDGCQYAATTDLLTSNNFWMLNSAVQEEDRFFLGPFYPTSAYQTRRPLTRRTVFCSSPGSYDFLWLICDDKAQFTVTGNINIQLAMDTGAGYGAYATTSSFVGTSCVLAIPTGYGNSPTLSTTPNVKRYKIRVQIDGNTVMEVEYSVGQNCGDIELYSLNDYGGYDTTRWDIVEEQIELTNETPCVGTPCYNTNSIESVNYAQRLSLGGRAVLQSDLLRRYVVYSDVEVQNTEEERMFYEGIIKSPSHFIRFTKNGEEFHRNIFLESGTFRTVETEDGKQRVELTFLAHKNQHVQI